MRCAPTCRPPSSRCATLAFWWQAIPDVAGRSDDPAPVPLAPEVIHVGFDSHHVVLRSASPQVAAELRALLGPMVIHGPAGTPAGQLEAVPDDGSIRIVGAPDAAEPLTVEPDWAPRELYHATLKLLMLARQDLVWIHAGVAAYGDRALSLRGPLGTRQEHVGRRPHRPRLDLLLGRDRCNRLRVRHGPPVSPCAAPPGA